MLIFTVFDVVIFIILTSLLILPFLSYEVFLLIKFILMNIYQFVCAINKQQQIVQCFVSTIDL